MSSVIKNKGGHMNEFFLWDAKNVSEALGLSLDGDWQATGVSIDSRTIHAGDLYVALLGEHHDGHSFVEDAFQNGAVAAIVDRDVPGLDRLIVVSDTLKALEDLAHYARSHTHATIVGVTGSVGKTTVKEALAHALSGQGKTFANSGSLNNHIGTPLSVGRLPKEAVFGVFEMGMDRLGEISHLTKIVRPNVAIITAVREAHMLNFQSLDEIAQAKSEIFDGLQDNGVAIISRDTPYFDMFQSKISQKIITFGEHESSDFRLLEYSDAKEKTIVHASIRGKSYHYKLSLLGRHNALNSLIVLAAVEAVGADVEKAMATLETFFPLDGRGRRYDIHLRHGMIKLIDESYNSNVASLSAALSNFSYLTPSEGGRRIAVIGDMAATSVDAHVVIGQEIAESCVDLVYACGENAESLYEQLRPEQRAGFGRNSRELAALIPEHLIDGDIIIVKGARFMKMEEVVDAVLTYDQPYFAPENRK